MAKKEHTEKQQTVAKRKTAKPIRQPETLHYDPLKRFVPGGYAEWAGTLQQLKDDSAIPQSFIDDNNQVYYWASGGVDFHLMKSKTGGDNWLLFTRLSAPIEI